jgi:hypothetical protein
VFPLVDTAHAPFLSAHDGATSGAPVTSQAFWLLPLLQLALYCEDAVAPVAQLHVRGEKGGRGGGTGGAGGNGGGLAAGGGGDGEGGLWPATTCKRTASDVV